MNPSNDDKPMEGFPSFGDPEDDSRRTACEIAQRVEDMVKRFLRQRKLLQDLAAAADQVRCAWIVENGPCCPATDLGYALAELEQALINLAMETSGVERHPLDE